MGSAQTARRVRHGNVLVVDDDAGVHRLLGEVLQLAHYDVCAATTSSAAIEAACRDEFDIILLDVGLPDTSGIETLQRLRSESISAGIVMISGDDDAKIVVEAMRLGALDYLVKPLSAEKVLATVTLAVRAGRLERENRRLVRKLEALNAGQGMVGCSTLARRLAGVLRRVADSEATVLIEGKPGSGKTMAADIIHKSSRRSAKPLVAMASDTITPETLEQALLDTDQGTLLLEDVDLLGPAAQSRLVRYLKERGTPGAKQDVRVIATTSAKLPEMVARGKFREDLYYRLNVFPIQVPSLHERKDDVALLATHFLKQSEAATGLPQKGFSASAMILLESHPWPGNVAQLQNAIIRAHSLAGGATVESAHLLGPSTGLDIEPPAEGVPAEAIADQLDEEVREEDILPLDTEEKRLLARALRATQGNVRRAAQLLRIGRATLYRKIQVYKLRLH
jgi:two-component system response regulator HydG